MALYQLHLLSPSASFNFSFLSEPKKSHLKRNSHQNPVHGGVIYASSAENPKKKKGRPSRAAMSAEDLCKELREVILVAGLPLDRVPLLKELCEHGREDLANIVRRRGYRVVKVLLSTSNLSDNHRENFFVEDQERSDPQGDEASEFEETHLGSAEGISSLRISSVVDDYDLETNGTTKNDMPVQIGEPSRSSNGLVNLVSACSYQKSELDLNVFGTNEVDHAFEEEQLHGTYIAKSDGVINQAKRIETNEDLASNIVVFAEDNSTTEIDHLKALLHQKEMELAELKQHIEKEKQALSLLQARAKNEIDSVHKVILTKDAELSASKDKLSELKEVSSKVPVDVLDITGCSTLIITVFYLQVQIQFCVNGESVVVAGSFNGWHKQIKMNMQMSSRTIDVQGSRVSKLWSTILWLYPGTYEIKFIVDGQWMIDPLKEVTTNGHITNNVLRVGR